MDRAKETALQKVTRCLDSWHRNFLAIVYKQSGSDGPLIDFESVNTSKIYMHHYNHLATVAWQQPCFFQ